MGESVPTLVVTNSLSPQRERLAEALAIERLHDEHAAEFIAERIWALTLERDEAGVQRWREIAHRYDQLWQRGRAT